MTHPDAPPVDPTCPTCGHPVRRHGSRCFQSLDTPIVEGNVTRFVCPCALSRLTLVEDALTASHAEIVRLKAENDALPMLRKDSALMSRLVGLLLPFAGETFQSEGAVDVLVRIIADRAALAKSEHEALAAHAASFGALRDISLLTDLGGEVDEYADVTLAVERICASRDALARDAARERETLWRWCYSLLLAGAKAELARENGELREAGTPDEWPAQQEWSDLGNSSHSVYLRRVRELAGIDHDAFLAYVRYERGERPGEIAQELFDAARSAAPSTETL